MEESLMKILDISTNRIKELTLTVKGLNEALSSTPNDAILLEAEINSSKLESGLDKLKSDLNNYFRLVNDPSVDDISQIAAFQLEAEETLCELKVKLRRAKSLSSSEPDRSSSPSLAVAAVAGKLPKLNLSEFDGDILQWIPFWDRFSSLVDNRRLSDVDKLLYLTSSLTGEAKRLIEGLETTNRNYEIAVTILKTRYGRTELVKDAHYSALNRITPAGSSTTDCRRVLNDIERHLRVLNSLGEDTTHSYLRLLILEKFPEELIYELKKKTNENTVLAIRRELEILISAKEDANRVTKLKAEKVEDYTTGTLHVTDRFRGTNFKSRYSMSSFKGNGRNPRDNLPHRKQYTYSLKRTHESTNDSSERPQSSTGSERQFKRFKKSCFFCRGGHADHECDKYKTVKERKLQLKGRCYFCFAQGHRWTNCLKKERCQSCKQSHVRALCPEIETQSETTKQFFVNNDGLTVLQTAIVNITRETGGKQLKARALLDSGSQRTYITRKLAKEMQLETIEESRLTIFTFGSKEPQEVDSPRVNFQIVTRSGKTLSMNANIVPMITHSVLYPQQYLEHWRDKSCLADDGSLADRVDLLIGNDYYFSLMSTDKLKIQDNLYMVDSELGWILSGRTNLKPIEELSVVTYFQSSYERRLNQPDLPLNDASLKGLWELEAIGITDSPKESREEEAVRHFNETTQLVNDRYHVSWPWISYPPELEPNYGLALGRLTNLVKRLDTNTLKLYDQLIKEQEQKEIIETVPDIEIKESRHPIHYLPHHCVKQADKPIRIVYDASSKTKSDKKCLNQCLYCGPLMLEDLTGLLLKFRAHPIGICADVEKAFLQIGLQKRDRDVTRFLWIRDIRQPVDKDNLIHMRFCRVPFGVIASPFLLNATIKHHLSLSNIDNVKHLAQDIYVDNLVTGTSTTEEAVELYENSKHVFQQISMNLREWSSNSSKFMRQVNDKCQDKVVKVLGLDWELKTDILRLRVKHKDNEVTKRGVLKTIAAIYDPCGYAIPSMLSAKLLLQDLWKMKIKWDAPLSKETSDRWKEIREELREIEELQIPRCYFRNIQLNDYQLHCFTDASTKAYSAVVYIVQDRKISFVIGKSRLAPVQDQADLKIPRLELLGALIGSRLIKYVLKVLNGNVSSQTLWTDSQIVVDWVNSDKLLSPFVSRRIEEIRKNTNLTVRHVPSNLNTADAATRPAPSKEDKRRWLAGPDFLLMDPSQWPTTPPKDLSFLAGEDLPSAQDQEKTVETEVSSENLEEFAEQTELDNNKKILGDIPGIMYTTVTEIKNIQAKHFPEELAGKETSMKRNLDLFIDEDGILRCKGRLKYANWTYDKRYPILIPKDSEYTKEIIMRTHTDNYHVGATHTLSIIRQSFWIPQGKRQVIKVINKCAKCIKHGGGPFKLPPTPALPQERVNYSNPYTFTGIDYLGPVLVKTEGGTQKRWICLFTCLAVRAIHLEVVQNLSAEEGLLALRRFVSTRNVPSVITSDNATNFKLMAEVLSQPYCIKRKIKWRFIPQLAPWFGGYYERLMAIIKNCLRKTLGKHLLSDNQLNTVIKEIEAVVNTRPLTYVDTEMTHILKPSDFIAMGRVITTDAEDDGPIPQGTQTKIDLVDSWKRGIVVLNEFKEMFINRYLMSLRERYSNSLKQPRSTSKLTPAVGQIVQIKSDSKNRENWQVGKIISLVKGADNMCRVAKIKVGNKELTRSIAHLYPLEVDDSVHEGTDTLSRDEGTQKETVEDPQEMDIDVNDIDVTEIASTHEKGEQETLDVENVYSKGTQSEDASHNRINTNGTTTDDSGDDSSEQRPRRAAAIKALEKIGRWTGCLTSLL